MKFQLGTERTDQRRSDRSSATFECHLFNIRRKTDRLLAFLLLGQWLFCIICALTISPLAWSGASSSIHIHVWAALLIGGLFSVFPAALAFWASGKRSTRLVVSIAQLGFSALIIHLMGGRVEAHFHVFGSLAILAFYRDYWCFAPAVGVTLLDHLVRGAFWPESVFGVLAAASWRAVEHAGWVAFETTALCIGLRQELGHLRELAILSVSLQDEKENLEQRVRNRTNELNKSRNLLVSVLNSIDAHVFLLNSQGQVRLTNSGWLKFLDSMTAESRHRITHAQTYLDIARELFSLNDAQTEQLQHAISSVIAGHTNSQFMELTTAFGKKNRWWYQVRVSRVANVEEAAAVIAHIDLTERVSSCEIASRRADELYPLSLLAQNTENAVVVTD